MKTISPFRTDAALAVAALLAQMTTAQNSLAGQQIAPGYAHPASHVKVARSQPAATTSPTGFTPDQIRQAYGFDQLSLDGTGQTIAITDAFGDRYSTITTNTVTVHHKTKTTYTTNYFDATEGDWTTFCNQFGLATNGLTVAYPQGQGSVSTDWARETALDIQWAHAIAPRAKIMLVISYDNTMANLYGAVDYAVSNGANIVSMSWGRGEFSGEASDDAHFNHPGVTFLAASMDSGEISSGVFYPSASPYVVAVGGTQLTNYNGTWSETAWSGSGGGISLYETMPAFQSGWQQYTTGNMRSAPDVCYQGGPSPGVSVYVTPYYGGWIQVYGTSVGTPQWAALIALVNSGRASSLSSANSAIYSLAPTGTTPPSVDTGLLNDIISGSNGGDPDDFAIPGYDFVTGLGSPVASQLVPALTSW